MIYPAIPAKLPHRWCPSLSHRKCITRRQAGPVSGVMFMNYLLHKRSNLAKHSPDARAASLPTLFLYTITSHGGSRGAAAIAHSEQANLAKFPHCLETSGLLPFPHLPHHHMVAFRSCKRSHLSYHRPSGVIWLSILLSPPLTSLVSLPPIPPSLHTAADQVPICSDGGGGSL